MKRLNLCILAFAILTPVFLIGPAFLGKTFPPFPLMKIADVFDVFTPLVLIPLYWLIFQWGGGKNPTLTETLLFLLLAAAWVEGQGMHLSANSIGHLIPPFSDAGTSDAYRLTYFYDEQLGHYLWHIGVVGLAALLVMRGWREPAGLVTSWSTTLPAGVIYGFTYFAIFLEGQTVPIGLPFALLVVGFVLLRGREKLGAQPVLAFFFASCIVAILFFTIWGLYWGGFPEFSEVGIIK